jgi:hypothetical protein
MKRRRGPIPGPQSPEEWQDAVDGAHALLALDAARQYGLVTGGPVINQERCARMLRRGAARGITPRPDALERFLAEYQSQHPEGKNFDAI